MNKAIAVLKLEQCKPRKVSRRTVDPCPHCGEKVMLGDLIREYSNFYFHEMCAVKFIEAHKDLLPAPVLAAVADSEKDYQIRVLSERVEAIGPTLDKLRMESLTKAREAKRRRNQVDSLKAAMETIGTIASINDDKRIACRQIAAIVQRELVRFQGGGRSGADKQDPIKA